MPQQFEIYVTGMRGTMRLEAQPSLPDSHAEAIVSGIRDRAVSLDQIPSGSKIADVVIEDDGSTTVNLTPVATGLQPQEHTEPSGQRRRRTRQRDVAPDQAGLFGDDTTQDTDDDPQQRLGTTQEPDQEQPQRRQRRQRQRSTSRQQRDRGQMSLTDAARTRRLTDFDDADTDQTADTPTEQDTTPSDPTAGNDLDPVTTVSPDEPSIDELVDEHGHEAVIMSLGRNPQINHHITDTVRQRVQDGDNSLRMPLVLRRGMLYDSDSMEDSFHVVAPDVLPDYVESTVLRAIPTDNVEIPDPGHGETIQIGEVIYQLSTTGNGISVRDVDIDDQYQVGGFGEFQ